MENVFVYGTLKRGFHNHVCLSNASFVGDAISVDKYRMGNVGGFPEVQLADSVDSPDVAILRGEIYICDDATMKTLDRLEGEGHMYKRQQREFFVHNVTGDSTFITCWVYLWLRSPTQTILPVDGHLSYV